MVWFSLRLNNKFRDVCSTLSTDNQISFLIDLQDISRFDPSRFQIVWLLTMIIASIIYYFGHHYTSISILLVIVIHIVYVLFTYLFLLKNFKKRWF